MTPWPDERLEKLMLADAGLLESMHEPTSLGHDAACHIRALLARVRELEAALAPPAPWRGTLGLHAQATLAQAEDAYRRLALSCHPDRGGSDEAMQALNAAIERARKELMVNG